MNLARNTDPVTSHMAAAYAEKFKGNHVDRILAGLATLHKATAHELSHETGLSVVQIDRRMTEIAESKKARLSTINGAVEIRGGARVWELVPAQLELI